MTANFHKHHTVLLDHDASYRVNRPILLANFQARSFLLLPT